jgi:hypothetical protein
MQNKPILNLDEGQRLSQFMGLHTYSISLLQKTLGPFQNLRDILMLCFSCIFKQKKENVLVTKNFEDSFRPQLTSCFPLSFMEEWKKLISDSIKWAGDKLSTYYRKIATNLNVKYHTTEIFLIYWELVKWICRLYLAGGIVARKSLKNSPSAVFAPISLGHKSNTP